MYKFKLKLKGKTYYFCKNRADNYALCKPEDLNYLNCYIHTFEDINLVPRYFKCILCNWGYLLGTNDRFIIEDENKCNILFNLKYKDVVHFRIGV